MYSTSKEYKAAMNKRIRNRAFITVSIGVINQEAQSSASVSGTFEYFSSDKLLFGNKDVTDYATFDSNFVKADGNLIFAPENNQYAQYVNARGTVTKSFGSSVTVSFGNSYELKGLTIEFADNCYPTKFTVIAGEFLKTYTNNKKKFVTTDYIGYAETLQIVPLTMVGESQRLRIHNIKMGIGIVFGNSNVESSTYSEFVNAVSSELPSIDFSLNVYDENNEYNVDSESSVINFLETGQDVNISYGIELDDGTVEYIQFAKMLLNSWQSKKGRMSFSAKDIFSTMTEEYSDGNTIHTRTLYQDAISVLTDFGLQADEYEVDECLKDITVKNPLPVASHAECLQIIANAGRCILYQNRNGKVCLRANFANVINPDDIQLTSTGTTAWSKQRNILSGSSDVYAEVLENFVKADGGMYFMPENNEQYLDTGYVSSVIADSNGNFTSNPKITMKLPASFVYYGVIMNFDGNEPQTVVISTKKNNVVQETFTYSELSKDNIITHEFKAFDEISFEFTKGAKNNRVLLNKIEFGNIGDYRLTKDLMMSEPIGYREERVKSIAVKVFTFVNDSEGKPEEVDDDVYYDKVLSTTGTEATVENQLVSTLEHAELLAEWMGNYYANNISYSADYRGDPVINAADIIYMDSDVLNNLQVEVEKATLTFNGAFGGSLELRRALNMMN